MLLVTKDGRLELNHFDTGDPTAFSKPVYAHDQADGTAEVKKCGTDWENHAATGLPTVLMNPWYPVPG